MSPVFAHGQLRLYVLSLLEQGPRHGYEIIQDLEQRFNGLYTPSAGTVYPRLAKLEQEGLVVRTDEGRKATYRLTDAGYAEVAARRDDLAGLHDDLERSVRELAQEVRERVQGSTADLREELRAAAREARATATPAGSGSRSPGASAGPATGSYGGLPGGLGTLGGLGALGGLGDLDRLIAQVSQLRGQVGGDARWPGQAPWPGHAPAGPTEPVPGGPRSGQWAGLTSGQLGEVVAILTEASVKIRAVVTRGR